MSWLLVAFIPGLLMLATFGLERLESSLVDGTLTASDVAEFLEQAEAVDMSTLAREGMPEALDCLHRRRAEHVTEEPGRTSGRIEYSIDPFLSSTPIPEAEEPGLPARPDSHSRANRKFGPPRRANRV